MSKVKIAISGIGAVGGYYGGMLASCYQDSEDVDIFFISRGTNLQAIEENGLLIKRSIRKITARPKLVTDNPAEIGPVDYLLCCTKSYDLEDNIKHLKPVIGPGTVVLPLLNGADISDQIQKLLPEANVWKGCVYIGARLISPGIVEKFTIKDNFIFGQKGKDKERQIEFRALLNNARISVSNPDDIDLEIWKKFFLISTTATLTSYFNMPINEAIENHMSMYSSLCNELQSIAEAKGIILPKNIASMSLRIQKKMPIGSTTSMHDDFIKGGKTEVETLTGYVVREADKLNVQVPTYKFLYKGLTEFTYPQQKQEE